MHTPGPWSAEGQASNPMSWQIHSLKGVVAARVWDKSDARLIAAAPELLAFAQWLLEAYHSDDGMPEAKEIAREARAAIEKATK